MSSTNDNTKHSRPKRDERGRFVKGTTPGPGRPRGTSRANATRLAILKELATMPIDAEIQKIQRAVNMAACIKAIDEPDQQARHLARLLIAIQRSAARVLLSELEAARGF